MAFYTLNTSRCTMLGVGPKWNTNPFKPMIVTFKTKTEADRVKNMIEGKGVIAEYQNAKIKLSLEKNSENPVVFDNKADMQCYQEDVLRRYGMQIGRDIFVTQQVFKQLDSVILDGDVMASYD